MSITRIGLVSLIVGLILLMNASSSHVSGYSTRSYDILKQNQTQTYVILIGPVGPSTIAIGGADNPSIFGTPTGLDSTRVVSNVGVYMKVTDPDSNMLAEQEVITPYLLDIDFKSRGIYTVYVTNKDVKETIIPITVIFETNNPQNKEADKFLLSLSLTALGVVIMLVGSIINFLKQRKQHTITEH